MNDKFSNSFDLLSKLSLNNILSLLCDIDCMQYSTTFRESKITGFDLCFLTNDSLKNELKVSSLHDRNEIIRTRDKLLLEQLKVKIAYENRMFEIQLPKDCSTRLNDLVPLVKAIFKINEKEIIFFNSNEDVLSPDCKIAELIVLDPINYRNLKIRNEVPQSLEAKSLDSFKIVNINNNNNHSEIKEYDDPTLYNECENKFKNSYSNNNNLKLSLSNLNNNNSGHSNNFKKDSNKALLVKEPDNNTKIENMLQQNDKEYKSLIYSNKNNQQNEKEIEKSLYSSRASSKNELIPTSRKTLASGKQSPERNKNVIDKLIEGFEKNKNLTDREFNNELRNQDLSKSSINQFNNKINQILKRNPSLDEKQFNIIKSSDLKVKIDSIRNEIQDSLVKDKESSISKKSLKEVVNNSEKVSISLSKNKKFESSDSQASKHQKKINSLNSTVNNENM